MPPATLPRVRLDVDQIARTRLIGMAMLSLTVLAHDRFILGPFSASGFATIAGALVGYALLAWIVLRRFVDHPAIRTVSDVLFVTDIAMWTVAIHATGG